MIVETFDFGWGGDVPLIRFQQQVLDQYLQPVINDRVPTVVVNSTWYTQEHHDRVKKQLAIMRPERLILTALMDPAIPRKHMFEDLDCEILSVGYYPGHNELDIWALIMEKFFVIEFDVSQSTKINTAFMSLNRKPNQHRQYLFAQLQKRNIVEKNVVSLGGERVLDHDTDRGSPIAPNPGADVYGIVNDIMTLGNIDRWNQCLLNVVTETVYDVDKEWFVSEKIYKPLLGERPFLVFAPNGARSWLDHIEIENYVDDFRDISDLDLSDPRHIPDFLRQLSDQSVTYLQNKYLDLQPKILHNKQKLFDHVENVKQKICQGVICQA